MSRRSHGGGRSHHHHGVRTPHEAHRPAPVHERPQINRADPAPPANASGTTAPFAPPPATSVAAPALGPEPASLPDAPGAAAPPDLAAPPDARPRLYDSSCTAPQLRRFIKSRAYVPMHELRRRFGINGSEDDVTPVALDGTRVYVGLPSREGHLLGDLLRGGEVGFELSLDPVTPIVVGVYPMRPVPRP